MKRSKWTVVLLVLALALGLVGTLAACGGEAGPVEDTGQTWDLKFSYGVPSAASLSVGCLRPWAAAVEEATDGRVSIEHYADGTMAKDEQQYDYLIANTSDLSLVEPEYTAGVFRVFELGSLPKLFPDPAVAAAVMWDITQEYPEEFEDVQVLGVSCIAGAQYIGSADVKLPEDAAGVKMRSGGKIESWILEELDAEVIDISLGDLGTSLERGLADGAFLSWSLTFISGAVKFTEYRTNLDLMYRPWLILMNKDVWNSMPPNIQDDIMSVSGQIPSVIYAVANELITNESREDLENLDEKLGNQPIYVPTQDEMAQWMETLKPVWQKWVDELDSSKSPYAGQGQEILDFIATKVDEYSTIYKDNTTEAQKILDARFE